MGEVGRSAWGRVWPSWVDRNFAIILGARMTMSGAQALAGIVTALYLAAIGFSGLLIGILLFCVALSSAVMSTSIGLVSDRVGRKPFLIAIPLVAAIAAIVFAFDRTPALLFIFAALGSFGRGSGAGAGNVSPYQPAESAFVGETVPGWARASAFGRMSFFSTIGALGGALLASLARPVPHLNPASATSDYRSTFLVMAALAAVAGVLAFWLHPRPIRPVERAKGRINWPHQSWPALWRFLITNGTNGLAIGMFGPFLSYWLNLRYGVSPGEIGFLFAVANLVSLSSTLSAASIGTGIGTVRAIVIVRGLSAILLVPLALAPTFWIASAFYLARMVTQRVGMPLRQSYVQELADPSERASMVALSNLPAQGMQAGSRILAGYLFDATLLALPFEIAAAFQFLNAVMFGLLFGLFPPRLRSHNDTQLEASFDIPNGGESRQGETRDS